MFNKQHKINQFVDAAALGDLTRLQELVAEGVPLDSESNIGYRALERALGQSRYDAAAWLIEQGATVTSGEIWGLKDDLSRGEDGADKVWKAMAAKKVSLKDFAEEAARLGEIELLGHALDDGADAAQALVEAAEAGQEDAVCYLVDDRQAPVTRAAVLAAREKGYKDIAELLGMIDDPDELATWKQEQELIAAKENVRRNGTPEEKIALQKQEKEDRLAAIVAKAEDVKAVLEAIATSPDIDLIFTMGIDTAKEGVLFETNIPVSETKKLAGWVSAESVQCRGADGWEEVGSVGELTNEIITRALDNNLKTAGKYFLSPEERQKAQALRDRGAAEEEVALKLQEKKERLAAVAAPAEEVKAALEALVESRDIDLTFTLEIDAKREAVLIETNIPVSETEDFAGWISAKNVQERGADGWEKVGGVAELTRDIIQRAIDSNLKTQDKDFLALTDEERQQLQADGKEKVAQAVAGKRSHFTKVVATTEEIKAVLEELTASPNVDFAYDVSIDAGNETATVWTNIEGNTGHLILTINEDGIDVLSGDERYDDDWGSYVMVKDHYDDSAAAIAAVLQRALDEKFKLREQDIAPLPADQAVLARRSAQEVLAAGVAERKGHFTDVVATLEEIKQGLDVLGQSPDLNFTFSSSIDPVSETASIATNIPGTCNSVSITVGHDGIDVGTGEERYDDYRYDYVMFTEHFNEAAAVVRDIIGRAIERNFNPAVAGKGVLPAGDGALARRAAEEALAAAVRGKEESLQPTLAMTEKVTQGLEALRQSPAVDFSFTTQVDTQEETAVIQTDIAGPDRNVSLRVGRDGVDVGLGEEVYDYDGNAYTELKEHFNDAAAAVEKVIALAVQSNYKPRPGL